MHNSKEAQGHGATAAFAALVSLQTLAQSVLVVFATLSLTGVDTLAPARGWRMFSGMQTGLTVVVLGSVLFKFTWWSRMNTAVPVFVWATILHVTAMTLATAMIMGAVEQGHASGLIPAGGVWFDGEPSSVWSGSSIATQWAVAMVLIVFVGVSTVRHAAVTLPAMLSAATRGDSRATHTHGALATGALERADDESTDDEDGALHPRRRALVREPAWVRAPSRPTQRRGS